MLSSLALLVLAFSPKPGNDLADLISFDAKRADASVPYGVSGLEYEERRAMASGAVVRALSHYPEGPLRKVLRKAFVVNRLWTSKTYFGGTVSNDRRSILIAVGELGDPASIESAVHHEIAHLIMDKAGKRFPRAEWQATNPEGYVYPGEKLDTDGVLGGFSTKTFDESLHAEGFLCRYGTANMQEDWATYGEALFADKEGLRALITAAVRHPRVQSKALIASAFYRKTFPGLWPDVEEAASVTPRDRVRIETNSRYNDR